MVEIVKPWVRALKYNFLRYLAEWTVRQSSSDEQPQQLPLPVFVIGCGRSGTTILGQVLSAHPEVYYLFEPYHLWAAIDPMTDVLNLYHRLDAHFLMNASHSTEESKIRFNRLIRGSQQNKGVRIVVEKTPLNAMRIGYLNALAPRSKFIHIVRDGIDVSCSIERIASTNSYQIAGKPKLNQWWGVGDYKWKALSRDGVWAGYYPDEVDRLTVHRSRGAYEWLVSLAEVDRWRDQLGDRLYEITYNQLTANPEASLRNICKFLELDSPSIWLNQVTNTIRPASHTSGDTLRLPSAMCDAFNHYQERFGFTNRAISSENMWF